LRLIAATAARLSDAKDELRCDRAGTVEKQPDSLVVVQRFLIGLRLSWLEIARTFLGLSVDPGRAQLNALELAPLGLPSYVDDVYAQITRLLSLQQEFAHCLFEAVDTRPFADTSEAIAEVVGLRGTRSR